MEIPAIESSRSKDYLGQKAIYFEKISHIFPKKFLLYSGKWNFLASSLKNSYIFPKQTFLIFQEVTCTAWKKNQITLKNFLYFSKKRIIFMFRDDCWSSRKTKKISHTLEWLLTKYRIIFYTLGWQLIKHIFSVTVCVYIWQNDTNIFSLSL